MWPGPIAWRKIASVREPTSLRPWSVLWLALWNGCAMLLSRARGWCSRAGPSSIPVGKWARALCRRHLHHGARHRVA